MASAKMKVAGTIFRIGTTATDPSGDTYTQIKGAKQVGGNMGAAAQVVDTTDLDDTVKQETKTLLDAGTIDLEFAEVLSDPGQALLYAAFLDFSDVPYNFRADYPNSNKRTCKAKVLSWEPSIGGPNAIRMIKSKISLTAVSTFSAT